MNDFDLYGDVEDKISKLLQTHIKYLQTNRYEVSSAQEKEFSNLKNIVAVEKENGIISAKQKGWEILSKYNSYHHFLSDIKNKSINTYL
ncbi:TPA: hypothetical protein TVK17_000963 [Streptococcus equi subsp. zooepidemicus]|nr:hypothetical protein [Streptococcus equi subsp. zooepidemicus]